MTRSILAATALLLVAAGGKDHPSQASAGSPAQAPTSVTEASQGPGLTGAGSTFTNPIMQKWIQQYHAAKGTEVNYQSIGSGGGIRQFTDQTVDFGGTDAPMTNEQMSKAPYPVLHFPTVMGAVAMTYNLPGFNGTLKLTPGVLADIFLGKITKWNDGAIAKDNPGVTLPASEITVVHRSDGSGTSYIWCDYLSKVAPEYKSKVGVATSVNWPVGVGGKGNEGVAGLVKQTPYSIGYVELIYALQNKLAYGTVRSHDGEWLRASLETVTAAAAGAAANMPKDFRVSITNAPGANAYPIASFTWLLVQPAKDQKGATLTDFVKWALTDGQKYCAELGYAPLPEAVVALELPLLDKAS
jgi:phosphate transport system substrate-binding protein